jgi:hypothetical protein
MTGKPQFEHKNPRFFPTASYNAGIGSLMRDARGNDASGFGFMALLEQCAATDGRPGQMGLSQ